MSLYIDLAREIYFTIFNLNIYLTAGLVISRIHFKAEIPIPAPTISTMVAKQKLLAAQGYTSVAGRNKLLCISWTALAS